MSGSWRESDVATRSGSDAAESWSPRRAVGARGALRLLNEAGVLDAAEVQLALAWTRLTGEDDEWVQVAAVLAARAVRGGSVCVDLMAIGQTLAVEVAEWLQKQDPPWSDPRQWLKVLADSPSVSTSSTPETVGRPLRLVDGLLYLERYWQEEQQVLAELSLRAKVPPRTVEPARLVGALDSLFVHQSADGALFGRDGAMPELQPDFQRLAAAAATLGSLTVIAGGPGTGKTTTVARLLAVAQICWPSRPRIALAAPTGKAAARLQSAVAAESARLRALGQPSPDRVGAAGDGAPLVQPIVATTLHRLLGARPDSRTRFRHHRGQPLPYDLVVVDETSMVSLSMMSRLLEAVRPQASLVLVGDPDQLASVEAGAVLGDLVARAPRPATDARLNLLRAVVPQDLHPAESVEQELRNDVVRLRQVHRFGGSIAELAAAIRDGEGDVAVELLHSGDEALELVSLPDEAGLLWRPNDARLAGLREDCLSTGARLHAAALAGEPEAALLALDEHRLLCGHRRGPFGLGHWSEVVQGWLQDAIPGYGVGSSWYLGRPLIATRNDPDTGLSNGDTGVVVADIAGGTGTGAVGGTGTGAAGGTGTGAAGGTGTGASGGSVAVFGRGDGVLALPPTRLSAVETMHALTVHRSQGSQFGRVSVLLPPPDSPLLTRELLYTAVTRATSFVRVLGSEAAIRAAVARPVARASGLRRGGG